jgi:hypothetical protein
MEGCWSRIGPLDVSFQLWFDGLSGVFSSTILMFDDVGIGVWIEGFVGVIDLENEWVYVLPMIVEGSGEGWQEEEAFPADEEERRRQKLLWMVITEKLIRNGCWSNQYLPEMVEMTTLRTKSIVSYEVLNAITPPLLLEQATWYYAIPVIKMV